MVSEELLAGMTPEMAAQFAAMSAIVLVLFFVLLIGLYIYTSFAFVSIAKKARYKKIGHAWIPVVGPMLIASKTAKMHWWPILLLVLSVIPVLNILAWIALFVFFFIWMWKTFEAIKKPGWWQIFIFINPVWYILLGVAAWSKK